MANYPEKMSAALEEVLGVMNFSCSLIANVLRNSGHQIKRRAEAEQAYVIHWLTLIVLEHGDNWREIATKKMDEKVNATAA